jgi:hypothetical protein
MARAKMTLIAPDTIENAKLIVAAMEPEMRERLIADVYARYARYAATGADTDLGDWLLDESVLDNALIDFSVSDGEWSND